MPQTGLTVTGAETKGQTGLTVTSGAKIKGQTGLTVTSGAEGKGQTGLTVTGAEVKCWITDLLKW